MQLRFRFPAFASLVLIFTATSLPAAVYEVAERDPKASDDGPGSLERPWKTTSKAAAEVRAGDTVLIRDGIYRERVVIRTNGTAEKPIRFQAAPAAHVVLTGADRLAQWQRLEGERPIYQVPWPHRFITWTRHMVHPDDEYHRLIGRCEQVAVDNYLLRQVLEPNQLAPGAFYVDITNQVLQAWDRGGRDLNKVFAEGSVRQETIRVEGAYVELRGLQFRFAANMAQHPGVVLAGKHDLLEDCVIEDMNAGGAVFLNEDQVARRCVFRNNGQIGFGANGAHRLLMTECLVEDNNTKGWDRGWEAGGDKLVLCRDAVLERSRFVNNRGNGIWFDIGNEHCTVRGCLIADNEDGGIFYEISYGLHAQDNVIVGNGFAATAGAWGAQAGITLSSSPDSVIEHNLIVANREGFNFREQNRSTPRIGGKQEMPVWNHDETVRNNIIACNRDGQIWGWFDMKDNRHWPASAQSDGTAPGAGFASLTAKAQNQPSGLTLEKLNLRFENNVYYAGPGQGWFGWGPTWTRHKSYSSLHDFQAELGIDTGSRVADPGFADLMARDFRLKGAAMEQFKQCYPREPVPEVSLGIQP